MSWLRRWLERRRGVDAPVLADTPPGLGGREPDGEVGALDASRVGEGEGRPPPGELDAPAERLREARGTRDEAAVVALLLERRDRLDEPTATALAEVLLTRGEADRALEVLAERSGTRALQLRADLLADRGAYAEALGLVERVLARDLGAPGALERQHRWARRIGAAPLEARPTDDATAVLPTSSDVPFVVLRELARGGAGAVYEAEDTVLGRRVALKVHHGRAALASGATLELEMLERLRGEGVVRVIDAAPDGAWLALEWAVLGSLREWLSTRDHARLPPTWSWLGALARALSRVHEAGWVHYDLKPSNVLLGAAHEPWLTDFGIARRSGAPGGGGSPGYLSPERLAGAPASPADDVYGFGRVVEDVCAVLPATDERATLERLADACLAPVERRPASGRALLSAIGALEKRDPGAA